MDIFLQSPSCFIDERAVFFLKKSYISLTKDSNNRIMIWKSLGLSTTSIGPFDMTTSMHRMSHPMHLYGGVLFL